jgi:hypothetical protein
MLPGRDAEGVVAFTDGFAANALPHSGAWTRLRSSVFEIALFAGLLKVNALPNAPPARTGV